MVLNKWTTDLTTKFISLYEEQVCLWKTEDPNYRNKKARQAALTVMLERMAIPDLTVEDVKRKIKYVRSTYMIEINKIEKCEESGSKPYVPCLTWFNQMDAFLRLQIRKYGWGKNTTQTENSNDVTQEDLEDSDQDQTTDNSSWSIESVRGTSRHSNDDQPVNIRQDGTKLKTTNASRDPLGILYESDLQPSSSSPKRSRIEMDVRSTFKDRDSVYENRVKEDNEFDVFAKYVAIQLKSLNDEDAIMAQEEIQSILTKYKLKKIRRDKEISVTVKHEVL